MRDFGVRVQLHEDDCGGTPWALGALDPGWASLIQRALDDRPEPWLRVHEPADPEVIDRTLAFVDYALNEAASRYDADGESPAARRQ